MVGSHLREFAPPAAARAEFYDVRVLGQTYWGWRVRDESGGVLTASSRLFDDYFTCLQDAHRRG